MPSNFEDFYAKLEYLDVCIDQLLQEELKKSQQEKELVQQRARLYLADEQLLQSVTSVQQLANMETELEQALERVRARKVRIFSFRKSISLQISLLYYVFSSNLKQACLVSNVGVVLQNYVSSAYQAATMQRQQHEFLGNSYQQVISDNHMLSLIK